MKRRSQGSTERDLAGIAAKHRREAAAPDFVAEDLTGRFSSDPDLLKRHRRKRSTSERLEILEEKHDKLIHKVVDSRTKIIVAIVGAIGVALGYLLGGCV